MFCSYVIHCYLPCMQCFVLLVTVHIQLLNIILSSVLFKEKWNTCLYYFKLDFYCILLLTLIKPSLIGCKYIIK